VRGQGAGTSGCLRLARHRPRAAATARSTRSGRILVAQILPDAPILWETGRLRYGTVAVRTCMVQARDSVRLVIGP
jgi:hypothetical protein